MKILLASRNFFPAGVVGGAQTSVKHLAAALRDEGHEVAILSIDEVARRSRDPDTNATDIRLVLPGRDRAGGRTLLQKARWHFKDRLSHEMDAAYREVLDSWGPDVVNTNVLAGMGLGIWRAARQNKVPVVHTVHDYYLLCIKSSMRLGQHNCSSPCLSCRTSAVMLAKAEAQHVSGVVYVSKHMKEQHEENGVFTGRNVFSKVIHGIYDPKGTDGAEPRPSLPGRSLHVGFMGRISPEKGLDRLIVQCAALPDTRWSLSIAGSGEPAYIASLKALAEGLPVEFVGVVEPSRFLRNIDILIIPSLWHDPAPRVVYEAGLHGVIPLVSNRGGLPELVDFGRRGLVFDLNDNMGLALAINKMIEDPAIVGKMRAAWEEVRSNFSSKSVARETLSIYEAVTTRSM